MKFNFGVRMGSGVFFMIWSYPKAQQKDLDEVPEGWDPDLEERLELCLVPKQISASESLCSRS